VEILDSKVFIASDITEVSEDGTDEQEGFSGYEFNLTEYSKDEYIQMIQEKNADLETELTNTQLALCEVYELFE
ncbi:MAG: hypothetical protein LUF80_03525, partial [Oscillospiraceae bacterium]|nr:hypothetical protein [Oscillospiraceae bacterium]